MAKKVKPQYKCCNLLVHAPSMQPLFCPPTEAFCKYQAASGPIWTKVKPLCCKSYGKLLNAKCSTVQPATASQAAAPVAIVKNEGMPKTSIS